VNNFGFRTNLISPQGFPCSFGTPIGLELLEILGSNTISEFGLDSRAFLFFSEADSKLHINETVNLPLLLFEIGMTVSYWS
jgi:hypothetical protein